MSNQWSYKMRGTSTRFEDVGAGKRDRDQTEPQFNEEDRRNEQQNAEKRVENVRTNKTHETTANVFKAQYVKGTYERILLDESNLFNIAPSEVPKDVAVIIFRESKPGHTELCTIEIRELTEDGVANRGKLIRAFCLSEYIKHFKPLMFDYIINTTRSTKKKKETTKKKKTTKPPTKKNIKIISKPTRYSSVAPSKELLNQYQNATSVLWGLQDSYRTYHSDKTPRIDLFMKSYDQDDIFYNLRFDYRRLQDMFRTEEPLPRFRTFFPPTNYDLRIYRVMAYQKPYYSNLVEGQGSPFPCDLRVLGTEACLQLSLSVPILRTRNGEESERAGHDILGTPESDTGLIPRILPLDMDRSEYQGQDLEPVFPNSVLDIRVRESDLRLYKFKLNGKQAGILRISIQQRLPHELILNYSTAREIRSFVNKPTSEHTKPSDWEKIILVKQQRLPLTRENIDNLDLDRLSDGQHPEPRARVRSQFNVRASIHDNEGKVQFKTNPDKSLTITWFEKTDDSKTVHAQTIQSDNLNKIKADPNKLCLYMPFTRKTLGLNGINIELHSSEDYETALTYFK